MGVKGKESECWNEARKHDKLGTVGMIQKCHEAGFSRQTIANVFGTAFVFKALGKAPGETLKEPSWG